MKKLIINADDFGLSRSINRGIIKCFQEGVVRSATLMPNMPGFADAVRLVKENTGLGIGAHLNIYRGRPVLPRDKIPSLVNREGMFLASFALVRRIYLGQVNSQEVEAEFKAQIAKIKEAGVAITHLDSEKHFHALPIIAPVVARLAAYFNIPRVRLPREKWSPKHLSDLLSSQFYKMQYLAFRSHFLAAEFKKHKIKFVDNFYGILYSGKINLQGFLKLLEELGPGNSELMVHPGYVDEELEDLARELNNHLVGTREEELKILTHPLVQAKIQEQGIQLINYRDI